jgi:hypothetical protein
MVNDRRFPMPRRADKAPRDYVVRDVNGEALPRLRTVGIASVPEKMMMDPARPLFANGTFTRLPQCVRRTERAGVPQ